MWRKTGIILTAVFLNQAVSAQTLELSASNDSARFELIDALKRVTRPANYHVALLYAERKDDENLMGSLGVSVSGPAGQDAPGLTLGAGFQGLVADAQEYSITALPLMGMVRYTPPAFDRFIFSTHLFYAPSVLTFIDGDQFIQFTARAGYEILPEAEVFAGYRKVRFHMNTGPNLTIEEGLHVGLRISF